MPLTDVAIRNAKPDPARTLKLSDGGGLQLWITPKGSRLWCLAYRYDGKQRKLSGGAWPGKGLAAARRWRDDAKALLASGVDPGQQKRAEANTRANAAANTFGIIADELLAKKRRDGLAESTMVKATWLLGLARPALGSRPIAEITAPEILAVLRQIEERGRLETARKVRAWVGQCFRMAIHDGRAVVDPTLSLRGAIAAPKVEHRAAITKPLAFGGLLRAVDDYPGAPETRIALQLLALTFVRPGELRGAAWSEIDEAEAVWNIPAARMKGRRPHAVPLAPQALGLLRDLHRLTGRGALLFPSVRSAARSMSDGTLNAALRRLGFTSTEATSHGFRATASTLLNEAGRWNADAIEAQLAHIERNKSRRPYARGAYWPERIAMMAAWADRLDELRKGGKVIPFAA